MRRAVPTRHLAWESSPPHISAPRPATSDRVRPRRDCAAHPAPGPNSVPCSPSADRGTGTSCPADRSGPWWTMVDHGRPRWTTIGHGGPRTVQDEAARHRRGTAVSSGVTLSLRSAATRVVDCGKESISSDVPRLHERRDARQHPRQEVGLVQVNTRHLRLERRDTGHVPAKYLGPQSLKS